MLEWEDTHNYVYFIYFSPPAIWKRFLKSPQLFKHAEAKVL